jgi:hypothetical protein
MLTVPDLLMIPVFACLGEAVLAGSPLAFSYGLC